MFTVDTDRATTILGGFIGAAVAAEPVINAVDGSFHSADWIKLIVAIAVSLQGWATNKKGA